MAKSAGDIAYARLVEMQEYQTVDIRARREMLIQEGEQRDKSAKFRRRMVKVY